MNKRINEFLDEVCIHINCKAVHREIREELGAHLDGLKEEYLLKGYAEVKAIDSAIAAMGSTEVIGLNLNRQHKPQTEWSLLILVALITAIGGVVMFLSSQLDDGSTVSFSRYIFFLVIGLATMITFYLFDYTKLSKIPEGIYLSGVLLVVMTLFAGVEMNGARRWLAIGGYSISVPELASLLFFISFVGFLMKYRLQGAAGILKLMIQGAFAVNLLLMIPSSATAFIMMVTIGIVLLTAVKRSHFGENKRKQFLSLLAGSAVPAGFILYNLIVNPYLRQRFSIFLPGRKMDIMGVDYNQYLANAWLSCSNWFGKSDAMFHGHPLEVMPNNMGEFVLVNVIASLGWAAGITLLLLVCFFIARLFMVTVRVKHSFGFYLSLSAGTSLSLQFFLNIMMNFNLFPTMNFYLPFVSYGGTGYVISMALAGIILSVWRRNNLMMSEAEAIKPSASKRIVSLADGRLIIDLRAGKR